MNKSVDFQKKKANRLVAEPSAYLRQHGDNPVDWYPWGKEALERAKAEDKPIFLSIGYSACHWCHVMERESFEDESIALLMNTAFINIKVDREERPDLDHIYQTVVQLLGQSGGWPLTVFLTPDQKPFFGGTYFPPNARYGMPSFRDVLHALRDAYEHKREQVVLQAQEIANAIGKITAGPSAIVRTKDGPEEVDEGTPLGRDITQKAAHKLSLRFDEQYGGFGTRPKFPNTMNLEVLLRHAWFDGEQDAKERVGKALDGMRKGGIWDHLGGGFHRYSTDERWLVPHFEKMLYDNALLLRLYLDAGLAFEKKHYLQTAKQIAHYLLREMRSPGGAFYATQDADSEGEEGKFFVWTPSEIDAVIGADVLACEASKIYFGITPDGNFEHTGATVLSEAVPIEHVARRLEKPEAEVHEALERAKKALFTAREHREKPFRDEKILACWNGLIIGALAALGGALHEASWVNVAQEAFAYMESKLVQENGNVARFATNDGFVREPGYLDDHATIGNAALDLYEVTGEPRYVISAKSIADAILARFADTEHGGFFFTPIDGETLLCRTKDSYDQATPSGPAMASLLLLRLSALSEDPTRDPSSFKRNGLDSAGEEQDVLGHAVATRAPRRDHSAITTMDLERKSYEQWATAYLESVAALALENPLGLGQTLCVLDRLVRGSIDIVIVGARADARTQALHQAALRTYVPNRTMVLIDPADPSSRAVAKTLMEGKKIPDTGEPSAYVCKEKICSLPVQTPDALHALLAPFPS